MWVYIFKGVLNYIKPYIITILIEMKSYDKRACKVKGDERG